ncbi:kinase-like domain-containing protein [Lentinula lateritia]|uniref:Kinase-like domain-containing protein n=1 Tax=Lentinula lateritia TaxID=40482 RepID=A0ABQ8V380_9AGAR|nr:kinase-like domain-containing protein [Lentinula lateritia]
MDLLQLEMDTTSNDLIEWASSVGIDASPSLLEIYRKKCLQFSRRLSKKYQILPSSMILREIEREGQNPVGGGGFADIWRGAVNNQSVCLKVLRLVIEPDEEVRQRIRRQFCNEALLWRQLKHPNILPLLGVNEEIFSPSFCLVSPWMANKDIITYLKANPTHSRHNVLTEIAAGLTYLHSRTPPIIHGDIRGANILVTEDFHCCLADFGLALVTADSRSWSTATTSTGMKGAIRWMAPELIIQGPVEEHPHPTSRDIYAFGCTVVEILTLKVPFHDQKTDAAVIYSLMLGERPARPQDVWCPDTIWDLTTRCWTKNPALRPYADDIHGALLNRKWLWLNSLAV